MSFAELLAKHRKEKKMTQQSLLDGLGNISARCYISNIETGKHIAPPVDKVRTLAKLLNLTDEEAYDFALAAFEERNKEPGLLKYIEEISAHLNKNYWKYHFLTSTAKDEILDSFFENELKGFITLDLRDHLVTPAAIQANISLTQLDEREKVAMYKIIDKLKDKPEKIEGVLNLVFNLL